MNTYLKYLILSTLISLIAAYFMTKSDSITNTNTRSKESHTVLPLTEEIKPQTDNIKLTNKQFNEILLTIKDKGLLDETSDSHAKE